jgi:sugar phosphate isomerase/epimerase
VSFREPPRPAISRRGFIAGVAAVFAALARSKVGGVSVGVCTRDLAGAAKYGFDYIEPAAAEIAAMSDADVQGFAVEVLASPIRCRAFNSFIRRPELKVVGPNVSASALAAYVEHCVARCKQLGARVVVWGSAGSRNVPADFPRQRAFEQIIEFLRSAGQIARRHDIVIAIEPLRRQESNILNTGAEALQMVRAVRHPNVRMIVDYFHLREENEDPRIVETARSEIVHMHFANPHGRLWPHSLSEDSHYTAFFRYLKKIRYSGGISIEGEGSFAKDGAASREFFREALA